MAAGLDFAGMVPGFDFLQGLMKGAGAAMPAMGQWVAPTLDPAELEKRIGELRTVQFWLEQNAKLLGTTIQAMEVQRMTLATLQTMNLPMTDLRDALSIKPPSAPAPSYFAASPPAPVAPPPPPPAPVPEAAAVSDAPLAAGDPAAPGPAVTAVDPMKWWGALTQQFTEIASKAMQAGAAEPSAVATAAAAPARTRRSATAKPAANKSVAAKARKTTARSAGPRRA